MAFDGLLKIWLVCRGIGQGENGSGALVAKFNGIEIEPGGPYWKSRHCMKITDEGFCDGQMVGSVCLQSRLVGIVCRDREIVRCRDMSNTPEAHNLRLLSPCKYTRVFLVVDNDLIFGEDDFTVNVALGLKTNQGMLE